jgi:ribosomal protein L11 methyltransferase
MAFDGTLYAANTAHHRAYDAEVLADVPLGPGGSVLDLGCGSGVVAIAAAKLGFAPVVALDSDEHAVEATRANAAANGVDIDAACADVLAADLPETDVTVANITRETLEALAPRLRTRRLVGSGYLPTGESALAGFRHTRRLTRESWAADLYEAA